ncbi:MAG: DUF1127 domain-containing protein [Pseudomonadota bacterium]
MVYATAVNSKAFFGADSKGTFNFPAKVWNSVTRFFSLVHVERQLNSLDDRMLADIGIERADIRSKVWGHA